MRSTTPDLVEQHGVPGPGGGDLVLDRGDEAVRRILDGRLEQERETAGVRGLVERVVERPRSATRSLSSAAMAF
ncbi:hypothetical protein WDA79_21685 [Streptomyces sp. A475]|uniref:hypothetical protein n=1 Tax=Streptomyces sp. A475 TaxID=3131976 RepID=UPI0030C9D416